MPTVAAILMLSAAPFAKPSLAKDAAGAVDSVPTLDQLVQDAG